ncbi:hypothetical protein HDU67_010097 [Dinochytrium kinnereticum]|nr:hypothetical protein HDU67_010097 [Dinochytrium kinnereticum]
MKVFSISSLLLLLGAITATTNAQATETIFLANCEFEIGSPSSKRYTSGSQVLYYSDGSRTWNNERPTAIGTIRNPGKPYTTWEVWTDLEDNSQERSVIADFPDGNFVEAKIITSAQHFHDFDVVGAAKNAYNDYICRKDNRRTLFAINWNQFSHSRCHSLYYCTR